jgi:hypothetical protein
MRKLIPINDRVLSIPNQEKKMKKRKSKRTKGQEEVRPFEGLSKVHQNAAGVDIGATEIMACVSGGEEVQLVKAFGNYTVDLHAICTWFRQHGVQTVAMESTGVYWIPLFEELERQGFECLLISSRSLRKVAGQKTDVEDAQWIQTLHSYGLLKGSFRPQGDLVALRTLLRHRAQLVEHRSPHTAQRAYAEGTVANEHPVEPGGDGCDGVDRAKDHPCDRGRAAKAGRIGNLTGSRL